jgi:hypothetical protein
MSRKLEGKRQLATCVVAQVPHSPRRSELDVEPAVAVELGRDSVGSGPLSDSGRARHLEDTSFCRIVVETTHIRVHLSERDSSRGIWGNRIGKDTAVSQPGVIGAKPRRRAESQLLE